MTRIIPVTLGTILFIGLGNATYAETQKMDSDALSTPDMMRLWYHDIDTRQPGSIIEANSINTLLRSITTPIRLRLAPGAFWPIADGSFGHSLVSLPPANYNLLFVSLDSDSVGGSHLGAESPDWNDSTNLGARFGESTLYSDLSRKWGQRSGRYYSDGAIYDWDSYRTTAPVDSTFYTIEAVMTSDAPHCVDPAAPGYNAYWCSHASWSQPAHYNVAIDRGNVGTSVFGNHLDSGGTSYRGDAFDIISFDKLTARGTNWVWNGVHEVDRVGGLTATGFNDANGNWTSFPGRDYVEEYDYGGHGAENPATRYDSSQTSIHPFWFNSWWVDSDFTDWRPRQAIPKFALLVVRDHFDQQWMYTAMNAGVTDNTEPLWSYNEATPVHDGTVSWRFSGRRRVEIGSIMGFGSDTGVLSVGSLINSSLPYYHSVFDLAKAGLTAEDHAWVRVPPAATIDLTANDTPGGNGNHLFGYTDYSGLGWNNFEFSAKSRDGRHKVVWGVQDSGITFTSTEIIAATGSSAIDAASVTAAYTQVASGSAHSGIVITMAGQGSQMTIHNTSRNAITVYPAHDHWSFNGRHEGVPLILLPDMSITVKIVAPRLYDVITTYGNTVMSRAAILAISHPEEGMHAYNTDDHVEVQYRCIRPSPCGWYPTLYGATLRQ